MKLGKSRLSTRALNQKLRCQFKRLCVSLIILGTLLLAYVGSKLIANAYIFHPVQALANTDLTVVTVEKKVPVVHMVEVDRHFTSEYQQILAYIVEKFGDRSGDAIAMIDTCENHSFDPSRINKSNKNGTWDVGILQINVDPKNTKEVEKLEDYKYNIDQAYLKYHEHKNTFYLWSCGDKAGDYTYKMKLEGK